MTLDRLQIGEILSGCELPFVAVEDRELVRDLEDISRAKFQELEDLEAERDILEAANVRLAEDLEEANRYLEAAERDLKYAQWRLKDLEK